MLQAKPVEILIKDAKSGEIEKTLHTTSAGYDITYIQNDKGGEPIYINNLHNCDMGKKHIKTYEFVDDIKALHSKMSKYLQNFVPRKIRVFVDEEWEKTDQSKPNSCWKAKIKKASAEYNSQTGIEYIIDLRRYYVSEWSDAQINACLFGLLSRIQEDGSIRNHQMDDADPLVYTFGAKYLEVGMHIPNILEDEIDLKYLPKAKREDNGQVTMDDVMDESEEPEEGPQDDEPENEEPGSEEELL